MAHTTTANAEVHLPESGLLHVLYNVQENISTKK